MQHIWWIWALGSLLALVLEACFGGSFIFVFFAFGAAVTASCVGLGLLEPIWQQAVLFCTLTAASLLALRRPLMDWGLRQVTERDLDSIKGTGATVEIAMVPFGSGQVLHRGTVWMARNGSDETLAQGIACRVVAVENLTLIVEAERSKVVS